MKDKISWFNEIPLKVFFVLTLVGSFYFYAGDNIVRYKLPDNIEGIAYIVYLFCCGIFIVSALNWVWGKLNNWVQNYRNKGKFKKVVKNLDKLEKSVVREFYLLGVSTLSFPYSEPVIQGLVSKRVLINASFLSNNAFIIDGLTVSYRLNINVKSIIDPEKDLGYISTPTEEQEQFLWYNRPYWVND